MFIHLKTQGNTKRFPWLDKDLTYLSTPLDYLFLAMIISLVAVPGDLAITPRIPSAVIKAIFFILALKILTVQNRYYRRTVFWGLQLTLLVVFFMNVF